MKKYFFFIAFPALSQVAGAQTLFYSTMKIEFEKTVNVRNQMRDMSPEWYARMKDQLPQNAYSYFDFIADNNKTIYKPGREAPPDPKLRMFFGSNTNDKNVVYCDLDSAVIIAQKPVFEETFLMKDSLLNIKWKITTDTRNIAGFECRKAIGILYDTIGIFAFYTDELMVSGGPESINGLPGMILGLAIPRLHTTWFATKVEVNGVPVKEIAPEKKGKKVNRKEMIETVEKATKDWGRFFSNVRVLLVI